jgi:dipeptidase E
MSLILTSNGLSSQAIFNKYQDLFDKGLRKVAIVVTADPEYREKDLYAINTKGTFENIGYLVDFFDIEFTSPEYLKEYDIIYFIGGNPFYLLDQIRKTNTGRVLQEIYSNGNVISGSSAGSIVLCSTICLINEFDPQMNTDTNLIDFEGVHLTCLNICPHYSRLINKYENFEERICKVERKNNIKITRLNDGEAILIENDIAVLLS